MPRIIVLISDYDGSIDGIYSDLPYPVEALVVRDFIRKDIDREAALEFQVKYGGLKDHLKERPKRGGSVMPCFHPGVLELINDERWAHCAEARQLQRMSAAFLDGYLTSHGELVAYLAELYRSGDPDAAVIYQRMSQLAGMQDDHYDALSAQLNEPRWFDKMAEKQAAGIPLLRFETIPAGGMTMAHGLLGLFLQQYPEIEVSAEECKIVTDYFKMDQSRLAVDLTDSSLYCFATDKNKLSKVTRYTLMEAVCMANRICNEAGKQPIDSRWACKFAYDRDRLAVLLKKMGSEDAQDGRSV